MTTPHSKLSFDISSPEDFLAKLKEEQGSLERDLTSARHAINAALNAWHLVDWVWVHYLNPDQHMRNRFGAHGRDLGPFKEHLRCRCPALSTMHAVATGSKHVYSDNSDVANTSRHGGAFSDAFSKDFDISRLKIEMDDGSTHWFDLELCEVVAFWESLFDEYFL